MKLLSVFFLLACAPGLVHAATPGPEEILKKADRARGGLSEGLAWKISVETDGSSQPSQYDVQVKGVNVVAHCTAPARQKGETFLFNDRNLWIYRPGLKKPISLSPRQRLAGQAANGDIATTNYARDYTGTVEGEEKINGKDTYRLFLQAKAKDVTYDKIRYWVTKDGFLGIKAEFLTLEGKPFKRADFSYGHTIPAPGGKAPFVSRMDIRDAVNEKEHTAIVYEEPKAEKLGDALFNVNNLTR